MLESFDFVAYLNLVGQWVLTSGLRILLVLVIMAVALKLAAIVSGRMINMLASSKDDVEFQKRTATLRAVVNYLLSTVIFAVAVMMVLGEIGVEIGPMLAAAGVVGLAVGFGAQNLVQDVISGFFILMEDQIRIGDIVEVGGKAGLVERVNLRMTILRDLAGNVHYIRNGQIDTVTNMTKDYSRYVFDIGVAYREDVDDVMDVIRQIDEEIRADPDFGSVIREPLEILGVDKFADSAVVIKARTTTNPGQQWRTGREFNRRLKRRFDELAIEIPFPHRTLYMGQDKRGDAPPLQLAARGGSPIGSLPLQTESNST